MTKPESAAAGTMIATAIIVYIFVFTNLSARLKLWQGILIWGLISAAGFTLGWLIGKDEKSEIVIKVTTPTATATTNT